MKSSTARTPARRAKAAICVASVAIVAAVGFVTRTPEPADMSWIETYHYLYYPGEHGGSYYMIEADPKDVRAVAEQHGYSLHPTSPNHSWARKGWLSPILSIQAGKVSEVSGGGRSWITPSSYAEPGWTTVHRSRPFSLWEVATGYFDAWRSGP